MIGPKASAGRTASISAITAASAVFEACNALKAKLAKLKAPDEMMVSLVIESGQSHSD